ncbi:MAG: ATP-binding protein [Oscillospiraceae bacterium]|nr:ATP-binding protein [Oscillospiraceae bacterium]
MSNPFNPSFGKRPVHYYGRQEITRSIIFAVDEVNSPWRTTLITGVRGSGKTALLSDVRANLDKRDIISLYLVPNEALLDSILSQLYRQIPKSISDKMPEFSNFAINLGISVGFEKDNKMPNFTETFSYQIIELLDVFKKLGKHVVFLVDEAQKHTSAMRIFISAYQDLVMREYSVSMVLASLPSAVSDLLNDDVLTFLRRAKQIELENVEIMIVEHEFKKVFLNSGTSLSENTVIKAANCTYGYPYLIQLVGYHLWEEMQNSDNDNNVIDDVLIKTKTELFRNVHRLIFIDLSPRDREFLISMSEDEGVSAVSVIGDRINKKKNYISLYRDRLISAGVVRSAGYGLLCISYPYMKEFLLQRKEEMGY